MKIDIMKRMLAASLYVFLTVMCFVQVNVSELGLVTQGGKVVWGKYNNPPRKEYFLQQSLLSHIT